MGRNVEFAILGQNFWPSGAGPGFQVRGIVKFLRWTKSVSAIAQCHILGGLDIEFEGVHF